MAGRVHPVPGQYEVLTDRTEAREKRLRASGISEALHLAFAPACRLVTVFRTVIDPGRSFHEDVLPPASSGSSALAAG